MAEKEKKKFKIQARIIDNKVLGYEDVLLDDHANMIKYIIHAVDVTMVVSVFVMIRST